MIINAFNLNWLHWNSSRKVTKTAKSILLLEPPYTVIKQNVSVSQSTLSCTAHLHPMFFTSG